jgi:hypothetical protein
MGGRRTIRGGVCFHCDESFCLFFAYTLGIIACNYRRDGWDGFWVAKHLGVMIYKGHLRQLESKVIDINCNYKKKR